MKDVWYTVSQAAGLLQLHEKTVQRYIREGKLPATKIGRNYRISGHDLSVFTGQNAADEDTYVPTPQQLQEKPSVSAVIDCFVGDNEQAMRISNSFNAVMNSKMPEETPGRFDFIYFQEEQRGKLVLSGSPLLVSRLLQIADQLLQ
jgi:excisionase family DNA binding protein